MANLLQTLRAGVGRSLAYGRQPTPRPRPYQEMGVSGTAVWGGYVQVKERSPEWIGRQKWITASELAVNTSIVAAGVHYFLNLVAYPKWTVRPVDEKDEESLALAEFTDHVLNHMDSPWYKVVRRAAMYRFHGFGIQEWTAKHRDDGLIGFKDVEARPQHTIEQWDVDLDGTVLGVWQRSPQTGHMLGIPRDKTLYLVEDTLTDSPEGIGMLRHIADPYKRLKQLQELEIRAYERDLRGIPIARAPITFINKAVKQNVITQAEANKLISDMQGMVEMQVKQSDTGLVMDSLPYFSDSDAGDQVSGVPQWSFELLSGAGVGHAEIAAAIDRVQREIARIIGVEHLMMGDVGGNRSLAEDKSRNLYLIANSVLKYISSQVKSDIVVPLWKLNGFPMDKLPNVETEDVTFKNADAITGALHRMASAGAPLAPNDPVVNDVRDLLGVSRVPENLMAQGAMPQNPALAGIPPELQLAMMGGKGGKGINLGVGAGGMPKPPGAGGEDDDGQPKPNGFGKGYPEYNADQDRDESGKWTAGGAAGGKRNLSLQAIRDAYGEKGALARGEDFKNEVRSRLGDKTLVSMTPPLSPRNVSIRFTDLTGYSAMDREFIMHYSRQLAQMNIEMLRAPDDNQGKRFAVGVIKFVRDFAMANNVESIATTAALQDGGWTWPRIGFEVASDGDHVRLKNTVAQRLDVLDKAGFVPKAQIQEARDILAAGGRDMGTKLAWLDHLVSPQAEAAFKARFPIAPRGVLTLGKVLLAGTKIKYVLRRENINSLDTILRGLGKAYNGGDMTKRGEMVDVATLLVDILDKGIGKGRPARKAGPLVRAYEDELEPRKPTRNGALVNGAKPLGVVTNGVDRMPVDETGNPIEEPAPDFDDPRAQAIDDEKPNEVVDGAVSEPADEGGADQGQEVPGIDIKGAGKVEVDAGLLVRLVEHFVGGAPAPAPQSNPAGAPGEPTGEPTLGAGLPPKAKPLGAQGAEGDGGGAKPEIKPGAGGDGEAQPAIPGSAAAPTGGKPPEAGAGGQPPVDPKTGQPLDPVQAAGMGGAPGTLMPGMQGAKPPQPKEEMDIEEAVEVLQPYVGGATPPDIDQEESTTESDALYERLGQEKDVQAAVSDQDPMDALRGMGQDMGNPEDAPQDARMARFSGDGGLSRRQRNRSDEATGAKPGQGMGERPLPNSKPGSGAPAAKPRLRLKPEEGKPPRPRRRL